jgi:hypothetical protein
METLSQTTLFKPPPRDRVERWDAAVRNDLVHAIAQVQGFYGKKLDQGGATFWLDALWGNDVQAIKNALIEYTKTGKFAPRPAHIIEIMDLHKAKNRAKVPPPQDAPPKEYDKEIATAWVWFFKIITVDSVLFKNMFDAQPDVDPETAERYLRIVNEQAMLYNTPDAIPEEFKLKEVWG